MKPLHLPEIQILGALAVFIKSEVIEIGTPWMVIGGPLIFTILCSNFLCFLVMHLAVNYGLYLAALSPG